MEKLAAEVVDYIAEQQTMAIYSRVQRICEEHGIPEAAAICITIHENTKDPSIFKYEVMYDGEAIDYFVLKLDIAEAIKSFAVGVVEAEVKAVKEMGGLLCTTCCHSITTCEGELESNNGEITCGLYQKTGRKEHGTAS